MARIVHICPRYLPARGGVESFFRQVSEALAGRGDHVSVWTTDAPTVRAFVRPLDARLPRGPETIAGVVVQRFPVRYVPLQKWTRTALNALPLGTRWTCATLRWTPWVPAMMRAANHHREPVDLVHVAGLPYSSLLYAGVTLARRTGARLVISPFTHVPPPGSHSRRMRRAYLSPLNIDLLSRADRVCTQTELERRQLAAAGIPMDSQTVVGVGIDPDAVSGGNRDRARARWEIPAGEVVVGHLANKSWDKGTLDLLEATARVWHRRGVTFRLVLAGPEMPGFATHPAYLAVRDRVVNLPELSDADRRDFFAGIDVFALPSYVESFGLSALEAGWCGAAVVAYDHGGPSEVWQDDVSARLVEAGDIAALALAIDALVADAGERARLAVGARDVARRHTWPLALGRALGVCDALLGRRLESDYNQAPS